MSVLSREGNKLIRSFDNEKLWIEPWGENSLRIRATRQSKMPDNDWALLPFCAGSAEISIENETATIKNGKINGHVSKSGRLCFTNQNGIALLEEFNRNHDESTDKSSALHVNAREFKPILGSDYSITMRFESNMDEKIFGMGQYQQPQFNLKGCMLELAQRNSQATVPFMLSSLGYGMLWNNPAIGKVFFGNNMTEYTADSSNIIDYWITAGDTPSEIEESYAKVTGTVPMMPDYAMGFWQCKLRYQTQEELLQVAREYKKRNLPISVIVIDYFHWPYQGDWRFDETYWPDPEAMIKELKEMGIELMVSFWPTVDNRSENYAEMLEKGFLINVDRGIRISMDFLGNTLHYDATHPKAREYVWEKAKHNYYDKGVKFFWLDVAEPEYTVYDFDLYRYHLGSNVRVGNIYPFMYAKTFFDGMTQEGDGKVLNLLRCAWAGSQRFGALVWSGDIRSSFLAFRNQLVAGLHMGIAGIPWWTTDIGGFYDGNIHNEKFKELLIRWFQYGTFCPVMRLHGTRNPQQPAPGTFGGGLCGSGAENEVWSYGEKVLSICEKYLHIREKMHPYIKQLMEDAHLKGTPVIRPLFYDYPDDKTAWEISDEYMFGPDVLVAPVLYEGAVSRQVYLPKGCFINPFTKQFFEGGQTITVDTPIEDIPLFVRKGSPVLQMLEKEE